jgi:hypothetical protein
MPHAPKDYLIYGDLLVTFACPLFKAPKKLDEHSKADLLKMPGVYQRGINGPLFNKTVEHCRTKTGLLRINSRGRWKKILGTTPRYQRPGWNRDERFLERRRNVTSA